MISTSTPPYTCKKVRVRVDNKLISVVELTGLELIRNGKVESKYGMVGSHSARRHSAGSTFARFSIRRWFKTGLQQPLLYNLHENKTYFTIEQFPNVEDLVGFIGIKLKNCQIYRYRLVTGSPNDIMAEEIIGEATSWESLTTILYTIEFIVSSSSSKIVFDGDEYDDGESTERAAATYVISWIPEDAHWRFTSWEGTGGVAVTSQYSENTTVVITGAGTLTLNVYWSC